LRHLNPDTAPTLAALPTAQIGFNYLGRTPAAAAGQADEPQDWAPLGSGGGGADTPIPVMHALEAMGIVHDLPEGPRLTLSLAWPERVLDEAAVRELVDGWAAMLTGIATHTSAAVSGGHTPSDFPLIALGQGHVEELEAATPGLAEVLPVTPLQEGLLFHALFDESDTDVYVEQMILGLEGPLDVQALRASWQRLLDRHAPLRAGFRQLDGLGDPVQVIVEHADMPWQEEDLSRLAEDAAWAESDRLGIAARAQRFDLAAPPLLRILLVKLAPDRYRMMMTLHHILLDGWSLPILMQELWTAYEAGGSTAGLPEITPYRNYLEWLGRQDKEAAREAWRQELAGADEPTLVAPVERDAAAVVTEEVTGAASAELSEALDDLTRAHGVTLNTVVQAAWALVVGKLTGRRDVVFGAAVAGRPLDVPGMESMLGFFINTVPVRVEFDPAHTVAEMLSELQSRQSALMDYQYLGLSEVQRLAGPGATFDTLMAFENFPAGAHEQSPGADEGQADGPSGLRVVEAGGRESTNYPLGLVAGPVGGLTMRLSYRPDVFDAAEAQELMRWLLRVLEGMAADPQGRVGRLGV
ncbi:non-ribosomal peptide synthetase, partial [Streptomyces sp. A7024]